MKVVVAGHLCLDIIPAFGEAGIALEPGRLAEVGAATLACGGGVANVGQALLKLGVEATLMGKVGDDAFGRIVEARLAEAGPASARGLRRAPGESTSYTVVLNPPGTDRMFLHHAGCNDTFSAEDIDFTAVAAADLFYFGYPPLMKRLYEDGGEAFAALLTRVKALGLTTVLDMAMPDPRADSGRLDWRAFLKRVLPHVDVFMPSLGELSFMLGEATPAASDAPALRRLAETLLEMGARIVGLKLGEHGLYLRSGRLGAAEQFGRAAPANLGAWSERELWSPVFEVTVKGTTGAGDATIAGFIAALSRGEPPERSLSLANAVGATSVEAVDSVSGLCSWEALLARLAAGWPRAAHHPDGSYWQAGLAGVYVGKHDHVAKHDKGGSR